MIDSNDVTNFISHSMKIISDKYIETGIGVFVVLCVIVFAFQKFGKKEKVIVEQQKRIKHKPKRRKKSPRENNVDEIVSQKVKEKAARVENAPSPKVQPNQVVAPTSTTSMTLTKRQKKSMPSVIPEVVNTAAWVDVTSKKDKRKLKEIQQTSSSLTKDGASLSTLTRNDISSSGDCLPEPIPIVALDTIVEKQSPITETANNVEPSKATKEPSKKSGSPSVQEHEFQTSSKSKVAKSTSESSDGKSASSKKASSPTAKGNPGTMDNVEVVVSKKKQKKKPVESENIPPAGLLVQRDSGESSAAMKKQPVDQPKAKSSSPVLNGFLNEPHSGDDFLPANMKKSKKNKQVNSSTVESDVQKFPAAVHPVPTISTSSGKQTPGFTSVEPVVDDGWQEPASTKKKQRVRKDK